MQDCDIKDTSAKRQDDVFLSGLLSGISRQRDKLPFLVMLTELLAIILKKVCLEFVLVKEVIPFIDYRLEPATTDGFGFLGHYIVEILHQDTGLLSEDS